jgi:hypothetical protein
MTINFELLFHSSIEVSIPTCCRQPWALEIYFWVFTGILNSTTALPNAFLLIAWNIYHKIIIYISDKLKKAWNEVVIVDLIQYFNRE